MTIQKRQNELIFTNFNNDNFLIHYAGSDLYFTMLDYKEENEFIINKSDEAF